MSAPRRRPRLFWAVLTLVVFAVAGGVSYLASSSPDGLETATRQGCEVTGSAGGTRELVGDCIAQNAAEHPLAHWPLADYAVRGDESTVGMAGVIGVAVTLVVAVAVFWSISRAGRRTRREHPAPADTT